MKNQFQQLTDSSVLENYPKEVQSKVVLGASKLSEDDFTMALSLFEQSIALDHQCGAAWLGKAYAEASLTFIDDQNHIPTIDHSLQTARKSFKEVAFFTNQQARVLETLIGRITDELLEKLEMVRKAEIKAEQARNEAAISALVTGAALGYGLASEKRTGKVLGYGTAAIAGANMVASSNRATEMSGLAGSVFGLLLAQCYVSTPVLKQAVEFKENLPATDRASMTKAINRWQAAAADCYNLQLSRLTSSLGQLRAKVSGTDALNSSGELDEGFQANFSEVSALKISAQMFGLNGHHSYAKLEHFLSELESTLHSDQAKQDFKKAKKQRKTALCVSVAVIILSFVVMGIMGNSVDNPNSDENQAIGTILGSLAFIGVGATFVFYKWKGLFKGQTQKKLGTLTKEFTEYVKNIKVSADDIVLSRTQGDAEATYTGFTATAS
ncbi:MAG: hypothetical protein WCS94_23875 [Verrucomicrobiota bacterium]